MGFGHFEGASARLILGVLKIILETWTILNIKMDAFTMDLLRLELRISWAIFPKFESTAEIESEWTSENPIQISQKYGRKGCYCYCLHGVLLSPQPAFIFLTGCFLDFLAFIGGASNPMKAAFSQHQ